MSRRTNFADPEREPTDEELVELAREAFVGVAGANEASLRALRVRIEEESAKVLASLEARLRARPAT